MKRWGLLLVLLTACSAKGDFRDDDLVKLLPDSKVTGCGEFLCMVQTSLNEMEVVGAFRQRSQDFHAVDIDGWKVLQDAQKNGVVIQIRDESDGPGSKILTFGSSLKDGVGTLKSGQFWAAADTVLQFIHENNAKRAKTARGMMEALELQDGVGKNCDQTFCSGITGMTVLQIAARFEEIWGGQVKFQQDGTGVRASVGPHSVRVDSLFGRRMVVIQPVGGFDFRDDQADDNSGMN